MALDTVDYPPTPQQAANTPSLTIRDSETGQIHILRPEAIQRIRFDLPDTAIIEVGMLELYNRRRTRPIRYRVTGPDAQALHDYMILFSTVALDAEWLSHREEVEAEEDDD